MKLKLLDGFTLAEVLITLGIIGIVAAMTMPSLITNYKKKQTVAQLKKVYSILSQAYKLSENYNGPASEWQFDTSQEVNTDNVKKYVQTYWLPYFKSVQECSKLGDCSYDKTAASPGGNHNLNLTGSNRYTIILSDGTMIAFVPFLLDDKDKPSWSVQKFYIDLNGAKRPNVIGKDVFMFDLDNDKIIPHCQANTNDFINNSCSKTGNCQCCAAKIIKDGWEITKDYPW